MSIASENIDVLTEVESNGSLKRSEEPIATQPVTYDNGATEGSSETNAIVSHPSPDTIQPVIFSISELERMTDPELLGVLRRSWGFEDKLEVWGELPRVDALDLTFYKVINIRSVLDNRQLEYPFDAKYKLDSGGIYIDKYSAKKLIAAGTRFIRCEAVLSPKSERDKHGNPLEIQVRTASVIPLTDIPIELENPVFNEHLISTEDATLITSMVYEHYLDLKKQEFVKLEDAFKVELEKKTSSAVQALNQTLTEHKKITAEILDAQKNYQDIENLSARLEDSVRDIQLLQAEETEKFALLKAGNEKAEQLMSKHLERLKSYIEDKATILKQLGFVDAEDFDLAFGELPQNSTEGERTSFEHALGRDYIKAVSYIQAYLLERDILYPRHILENFFTLLRTNDLIVLAGDSGSGKTNLVQSFAKAIGGVAKIIPVKPNWTSSEDLLGYYNPLDKKYLSTPFLDALIEASKNPNVPYLICLDEMNLARVEYYFADFLSKLEQRDGTPEIVLFSDSESAHVLSELRHVMEIIRGAKDRYQKDDSLTFVKLLQDEEINAELRLAFGFGEEDSLIKYHADIRRMLAGVLNTPSSLLFPSNVRIIGAINIDETTHYLSPKILDRAHVMKFKSPLLTDWQPIIDQVSSYGFTDVSQPLKLDITDLGTRTPYPKFDLKHPFCQRFIELNREYFHPIGVEFGLRTIRQGLNYIRIFSDFNDDTDIAINNFVLHKVLPKLTFDGSKQVSAEKTKLELLFVLATNLDESLEIDDSLDEEFSVKKALRSIAEKAKANDGIVNYWS